MYYEDESIEEMGWEDYDYHMNTGELSDLFPEESDDEDEDEDY